MNGTKTVGTFRDVVTDAAHAPTMRRYVDDTLTGLDAPGADTWGVRRFVVAVAVWNEWRARVCEALARHGLDLHGDDLVAGPGVDVPAAVDAAREDVAGIDYWGIVERCVTECGL